jgi:hypothetical protein
MSRKRSKRWADRHAETDDGLWQRLTAFWVGPVEALPLRIFESLFTVTFLIWMGRCFLTWEEWLTEAGFHLTEAELRSMGYPAPWPLLEPWQVPIFGGLIVLGAVLLLWPVAWGVGQAVKPAPLWRRRVGLVLLFATALYAQRVDYMAAFTLSKLYVGIYAVLMVSPGMWREPETGRLMVSAAPLRVIQATLILQYFAAGLAKADGAWLKGGDILWGQVQGVFRTETAAWALRTLPVWTWTVQQHLSLAFELLAPVLFCVRRLRPVAFVVGIGFHLVIALMMKDLILFSVQMWTFYAVFVSAEGWRRLTFGAFSYRRLRAARCGVAD